MRKATKLGALLLGDEGERAPLLLKHFYSVSHWLGSELCLFVPRNTDPNLLSRIGRDPISRMSLHCFSGLEVPDIIAKIAKSQVDLLVVEYFDSDRAHLGRENILHRRAVLEGTAVPVMLLPDLGGTSYRKPESLLIPLSSESRTSDALRVGLRIAARSRTPVDLVHVQAQAGISVSDELALESVGDHFHHEFPHIVDHAIASASPLSSRDETRWIRHYYRGSGKIADQIARFASQPANQAIVLDWHGKLDPGRAKLIKHILAWTTHPVILVKSEKSGQMLLRIGNALRSV